MKTASEYFKNIFGFEPKKELQLDTVTVVNMMQSYAEDIVADKDAEINAVYEGAELWHTEYNDCRNILKQLVDLKDEKDHQGKTRHYYEVQPLAWEAAKKFLKKYQHISE